MLHFAVSLGRRLPLPFASHAFAVLLNVFVTRDSRSAYDSGFGQCADSLVIILREEQRDSLQEKSPVSETIVCSIHMEA